MVENAPSNNVVIQNESGAEPPESGAAFSLENILGDNHDTLEHPGLKQKELDGPTEAAEGWDEESANRPTAEGFCVECEGEWGSIRLSEPICLTGSSGAHGRPARTVVMSRMRG